MNNIPCKDCKDRWVSDTDRCHGHCEAYKAFRAERDEVLNKIHKDNNVGFIDVARYRAAAKNKTRRKKRREKNAKKV